MPDRLLVDLGADSQVAVLSWPDGGLPQEVSRAPLAWPLDGDALEDLRWYLEDYLESPFGVWEERGPAIQARLAEWGGQVFGSVFGHVPARLPDAVRDYVIGHHNDEPGAGRDRRKRRRGRL